MTTIHVPAVLTPALKLSTEGAYPLGRSRHLKELILPQWSLTHPPVTFACEKIDPEAIHNNC